MVSYMIIIMISVYIYIYMLNIQEAKKFAPEEDFLASLKSIPGLSQLETQTYTIAPVNL